MIIDTIFAERNSVSMNIVLLSGGSGKRLWPLSNDTFSKQFLKLLKNDKGNYESMVQRVIRQISSCIPESNVFISCNKTQVGTLQNQLGSIEVITEPSRRNTFPAVVLSAAYLHYVKNLSEDDTFVILPIDVYANDGYFKLLTSVNGFLSSTNIGLMGAIPTYPSEKYGYINHIEGKVTGFIEKPTTAVAEELLSHNALWNCGVASLKIGYVLNHARKYVQFDDFESLYEQYDKLPASSLDYEVIEKEKSMQVVVYNSNWKDLGTWNTFSEEMDTNTMGNVLMSENSQNTHTLNMLNIPIIVQDISDAMVIASYDGILVTSKSESPQLKDLAEQISTRPMYEQRHWGDYRVLDYHSSDNTYLTKRIHIAAGKAISYQYHTKRSEVWTVVSGKGILTIEDIDSIVSVGSVIQIPVGAKHSLLAATDMVFIEVQLGQGELEEEDIVRL